MTTRPSRAGEKRSRKPDTRLMQVWPTFIHLPWTLWAAGCGGSSSDAAVRAKHLANVERLGAEDAYGLAVAEGEIDVGMQYVFANEACLEFAAFELFRSSGKYKSSKSAAYHWRKLSSDDKGKWVDQVDDAEFLKVAFRPWELRKGMSSDLLFAQVFPKTATPPAHGSPGGECESPSPCDSEDSDGDALAYRDQCGKRIKLGSKMPPVGSGRGLDGAPGPQEKKDQDGGARGEDESFYD